MSARVRRSRKGRKRSNVIVLADRVAARRAKEEPPVLPEPEEGVRICATWGRRALAWAITTWPARWSARTLDVAISFPRLVHGLDVESTAKVLDDIEARSDAALLRMLCVAPSSLPREAALAKTHAALDAVLSRLTRSEVQ